MTVNELKIQLESRQDLKYLRDEFCKYLEENSYTTTQEQRDRFLDDVFAIIGQNSQVDGFDTDKLRPESGSEEVDSQLEAKLEGLQAETDELLVKITELRRSCPEKIREKFFLQLEDLERAMPGVSETLSPLDINTELDDAVLDGLINQLGRLKELNESIPRLVSKLQRASTVILDSATPSDGVTRPVENLSDMLSRQRRIARQHDLASKLLAQQ